MRFRSVFLCIGTLAVALDIASSVMMVYAVPLQDVLVPLLMSFANSVAAAVYLNESVQFKRLLELLRPRIGDHTTALAAMERLLKVLELLSLNMLGITGVTLFMGLSQTFYDPPYFAGQCISVWVLRGFLSLFQVVLCRPAQEPPPGAGGKGKGGDGKKINMKSVVPSSSNKTTIVVGLSLIHI